MERVMNQKTILVSLFTFIGISLPGCGTVDLSKLANVTNASSAAATNGENSLQATVAVAESAADDTAAKNFRDPQKGEFRKGRHPFGNPFGRILAHDPDLSDAAKAKLSDLQKVSKQIHAKEAAMCGINTDLKTTIRAEIKVIKDDTTLTDVAKKEKIGAVFASHKDEIAANRKLWETCQEQNADKMVQFRDLQKSLRKACLAPVAMESAEVQGAPQKYAPRPGKEHGNFKLDEAKLLGDGCKAAEDAAKQSDLLK